MERLKKIEILIDKAYKEQSIDKKREFYIQALRCSKIYGGKEESFITYLFIR
jgi:hypothetical protein